MSFTRDKFTLFWSAIPDEQDWRNLNVSGVSRVMLTYGLAKSHRDVAAHLGATGKRAIIRFTDERDDDPVTTALVLAGIAKLVPIDAVILPPNEPDHREILSFESSDWRLERAYYARATIDVYRAAVRGVGLPAVSPALMMRSISEDDPVQPGRQSWREVLAPSAHLCDGVGAHVYAYGWRGDVDRIRYKFALKQAAEWWHKPLWIDEVGVALQDDRAKMQAYIEMADILMRHPVGQRVEMFCPFISTGTPDGWDARYLMRSEGAYAALGEWMRQAA